MKFEVVHGETEHITIGGRKVRNPTVLIRVGQLSLSKKALILGLGLILCQLFDGALTYLGLQLLGVEMEGNRFLRELMNAYGAWFILVVIKTLAIGCVVLLTFHAHKRRWIRPLILGLVVVYTCLAVVPWVYIISDHVAHNHSATKEKL
jgi:Domain of unknown function (DUF5658)